MSSDNWKRAIKSLRKRTESSSSFDLAELHKSSCEQWEKEKQELECKVKEFQEYKEKYEEQKQENEMLQRRLAELMAGQDDVTKSLMRSRETVERLQIDQKKKIEQMEKFQRDIHFKDDRIRNLEIRASEVEKAELILETTKSNLETQIQMVRVRDGQIRKLDGDIEDAERRIIVANNTISELTEKVEDLKLQVRHELKKNDNIEKNLETIPRLKDTIQEKEAEISDLRHQLEERCVLLTAARAAVREYKEKLRSCEREMGSVETLKRDLTLCQSEVVTLKRLMYGKDYLVSQRTRALDLSKEIISLLHGSQSTDQVKRIQQLLVRIAKINETSAPAPATKSSSGSLSTSTDSTPEPPPTTPPSPTHHRVHSADSRHALHRVITVNQPPYTHQDGQTNDDRKHDKHVFLKKVTNDLHGKRKRPKSAMAHPTYSIHRTSSIKEAQKVYTQPLQRKQTSMELELMKLANFMHVSNKEDTKERDSNNNVDHSGGVVAMHKDDDERKREAFPSESDSGLTSHSDVSEDSVFEQELMLKSYSGKEKDELLMEIISLGDRVWIDRLKKAPKYGKDKERKTIHFTGIVKFIGKFDTAKYDERVRVGVRLDEPLGDTDGTHNGKRYMYTPGDQGKYFKLREVISVLDVKTGKYVPIKPLMLRQIQLRQKETAESSQHHDG